MEQEELCPYCEAVVTVEEWIDGKCPHCGVPYWWDYMEDEIEGEWCWIEWEEPLANNV